MIFVDSHCHIDGEAFDGDRDEVVRRANDAGVEMMLVVGTGNPHNGEVAKAIATAAKFENVFASVGVHPHDAKLYNDEAEENFNQFGEIFVESYCLGRDWFGFLLRSFAARCAD